MPFDSIYGLNPGDSWGAGGAPGRIVKSPNCIGDEMRDLMGLCGTSALDMS